MQPDVLDGPSLTNGWFLPICFSENNVLQRVIRQMSVKIGWWIGSLPGNGVCECLIERDQFTVSQFLTNTCGIEEEILVRIQLLHEALGKTLFCKRDDGSFNGFPFGVPEHAPLVHSTHRRSGHRRPHPHSGHEADPSGGESPPE